MHKIVTFLCLNICYVIIDSIVNKILAHVILKYFSFHFIQILNIPTFPEFGLYLLGFELVAFLH